MQSVDIFTSAYLETALWAETDGDGRPLDSRYTVADFAPEAIAAAAADCAAFQEATAGDIAADVTRAGHDFWLTRNRHGAGFWDGDWADGAGERLTAAAHGFGEVYPYVGDDGRIYFG